METGRFKKSFTHSNLLVSLYPLKKGYQLAIYSPYHLPNYAFVFTKLFNDIKIYLFNTDAYDFGMNIQDQLIKEFNLKFKKID